jgi:acetoin utilization deacetylase AcuC-like enzyme
MLPIIHHAAYVAPTPANHRFPMRKFGRLIEILRDEGIATSANTREPEPVSFAALARAHNATYVRDVLGQKLDEAATRRIGFPISDRLVHRSQRSIGGTILTGRLALKHGVACNTAGGSHHAHAGYGAGYCVFNDVAVAIRALQADGHIATAMVIDLDVHQGDGTAQIFADDDSVFTFSMHCEANFPVNKEQSDFDMALPKGVGDAAYLETLSRCLDQLLVGERPDIVFYNAGVDCHADDRLGQLMLSDRGLAERDKLVLRRCRGAELPVACVLGGGYANDIEVLAHRHAILHRTAAAVVINPTQALV